MSNQDPSASPKHPEQQSADSFNELKVSYRKKSRETNVLFTLCSLVFVVLFAYYLWFLFQVYPQDGASRYDPSGRESRSNVVAELLDLSKMHEFNSLGEKRMFIEQEFNKRLTQYNRSSERLTPYYDVTTMSKTPQLKELAKLYEEFVRKYNIFLDNANQAKGTVHPV